MSRTPSPLSLPAAHHLPAPAELVFGPLRTRSPALAQVVTVLAAVARRPQTPALLLGESGTGKTLLARALHDQSARRHQPFVTVDCGALPASLLESELFGHERGAFTGADVARRGAFEEAAGGTLFLDEIGELPLELQAKLLRVVEARRFRRLGGTRELTTDVRIVAATNRNLAAEVRAQRFRLDLFHRLSVVSVEVPPLRARVDDLPLLVAALADALDAPAVLRTRWATPEYLTELAAAPWPGNVRELRNHLERELIHHEPALAPEAHLLALVIDLPPAGPREVVARPGELVVRLPLDLPTSLAEVRRRAVAEAERAFLVELLARTANRTQVAAAAARLSRVQLYRLLKRHGLR